MLFKKSFLSIICILICSVSAQAYWTNQIVNYTKSDYKAGSQNWQIIQHSNSWMYFANKMGVLEFNGKDWKLYSLNNQSDVRSILRSTDNKRIYVGGVNELGYLEPGVTGELKYHCLSVQMPQNQVVFGNIWKIHEIDRAIYFCADQSIVKWHDNRFVSVDCPDKIDCSNVINNTLYVGTNSGVYVLAGNLFHKLPASEQLTNKKLRGLYAFNNKILITTAFNGLFLLDDQGVSPVRTEADGFIKKNELFSVAINEKYIAIGTVLKGVVLLDREGKVLNYFNESHGLYNNTVLSVSFDRESNLWLGLDNGLAYIALSNPVTNLYNAPNFYGAGYAAALYDGRLYLGTNRGLFYINWPVPVSEDAPVLTLVNDMQGQVWNLNVVDDVLFCCLDRGLFLLEGKGFRNLGSVPGTWRIAQTLGDKDKAWISTYNGFYLSLRKNGKWQTPFPVAGFQNSMINFEEEQPGVLLVRNSWNELLRLTLNDSLNRVIRTESLKPDEIPVNSYIYKRSGRIILCSPTGFFSYDNDHHFTSDKRLNSMFSADSLLSYRSLHEKHKNSWVLGEHVIGVYDGLSNKFHAYHHTIPLITNFERLFIPDDSTAIVCNENGFASWRVDPAYSAVKGAVMQITDVEITGPVDSLIYVNSYKPLKPVPEITYNNNSLRFKYNLINYPDDSEPFFRCRLDDEAWSDYSVATVKEYVNISIGKHTFKVETKLSDGVVFSDGFTFVILPPWYRTNWAYLAYGLLLLLMLFGLWYWDDRRIKQKEEQVKQLQKQAMKAKEAAFKEESEKKEQEIVQLKNEQLEMEVKHKNQELANFAINLARKNEVLIDIKNDLMKVSEGIKNAEVQDITVLRRRVLRLNNKIDETILQDDSLKKFEEHFDLVHNNFMGRLAEKFPSLTISERKMCAFIKMHLSSKEMAPLLNLSIRGVETLRYRLRKKIGLNRDESLTYFLNQF